MKSSRAAILLESPGERRTLRLSLLIAFALEAVILTAFGWNGHWLAHPPKVNSDAGFIEAQIFTPPKEAHLRQIEKAIVVAKPEPTLSKVAHQGREAKPEESHLPQDNQTDAGSSAVATHGPLAIFSPPPKIPPYLQDQDLQTSVVIDFFVSSLGHATARLVSSSGNEELDALALEAVQKWQFRPAEQEHKAIDSKVRLRINFEVK